MKFLGGIQEWNLLSFLPFSLMGAERGAWFIPVEGSSSEARGGAGKGRGFLLPGAARESTAVLPWAVHLSSHEDGISGFPAQALDALRHLMTAASLVLSSWKAEPGFLQRVSSFRHLHIVGVSVLALSCSYGCFFGSK